MPLWQRLLITLGIMLLASYLVGLLWHWLFNSDIPRYLSGAVGGLTPFRSWESRRRIRPKQKGPVREPNSTWPESSQAGVGAAIRRRCRRTVFAGLDGALDHVDDPTGSITVYPK